MFLIKEYVKTLNLKNLKVNIDSQVSPSMTNSNMVFSIAVIALRIAY